jgi:hypothetical protein
LYALTTSTKIQLHRISDICNASTRSTLHEPCKWDNLVTMMLQHACVCVGHMNAAPLKSFKSQATGSLILSVTLQLPFLLSFSNCIMEPVFVIIFCLDVGTLLVANNGVPQNSPRQDSALSFALRVLRQSQLGSRTYLGSWCERVPSLQRDLLSHVANVHIQSHNLARARRRQRLSCGLEIEQQH